MNRPWKIWLAFTLCSVVLLSVLVWVSATVLRLERAQAKAQGQAELEEKVRLALWRMDSMLAPLLAQETARPYFAYSAFHPAERAYGKMYNTLSPNEVIVPSPLLTQISSNILLHFQLDAQGNLTSPQVPEGNQRDLAEMQFTTHEQIETAAARLKDLERILNEEASAELVHSVGGVPAVSVRAAGQAPIRKRDVLAAMAPAPITAENSLPLVSNRASLSRLQEASRRALRPSTLAEQMLRNDQELEARSQSVQQALDRNSNNGLLNSASPNRSNSIEDVLRPAWLGDTLVLIRHVAIQGQSFVQGFWIDWPTTRQWLLESVRDLLPGAGLEPMRNSGAEAQGRLLATLPARLVPGLVNTSLDPLASPLLVALALAWACVLVAGVAVVLLLRGTLSLSERRAAFVSAVTHELRTPLTTFKMYSEMLAQGMVPEESQRREYLSRLCLEADRLHHLVENVLAYARLERGPAAARPERLALKELLERVKPRLLQRAEQAGMSLQEDADPRALATVVQVDVSAVEQILFNLVDNACKYAAPFSTAPTDRTIHLEALPERGNFALLRVRDHGPGISSEAARRLFQPFSKSAPEAACTAPGVGLGLALCRRLGRSLGGELRYNAAVTDGACFELLLPIHEAQTANSR